MRGRPLKHTIAIAFTPSRPRLALADRASAARSKSRGFNLIELAITLAVIGMLAGSVLVPLVNQVAARNIGATEKAMQDIRDALIGYAAANGRLPCPASTTSNGVEAFAAGGTPANGNCATFFGFVPAVTLGITPIDDQGYAVDGWATRQNRIRYAVSNQTVNAVTNPFTATNGMRNATMSSLTAANLLYVCASGSGVTATNCGTAQTLTSNAPAVIWSLGANAPTGGTSVDEAQNPNTNGGSADVVFVSHTMSTITSNVFDDIVTWLSVSTLSNRMIASGQLP